MSMSCFMSFLNAGAYTRAWSQSKSRDALLVKIDPLLHSVTSCTFVVFKYRVHVLSRNLNLDWHSRTGQWVLSPQRLLKQKQWGTQGGNEKPKWQQRRLGKEDDETINA